MSYARLQRLAPRILRRYILAFEADIEDAVRRFASELPPGASVLDAGAGEGAYAQFFSAQRYCAADLGIGDPAWNYSRLNAVADLASLPFRDGCFAACVNIVTLEHVPEPARVIAELARTLERGGKLLLAAPHEWEVHQQPHDYFRFTRFGIRYLLEHAGFCEIEITPSGGYFRLLARRLWNGLQFFPGLWFAVAALFIAPPALLLPRLDFLDRSRDFTLGYICTARKAK